jgi:hypothetical protein
MTAETEKTNIENQPDWQHTMDQKSISPGINTI